MKPKLSGKKEEAAIQRSKAMEEIEISTLKEDFNVKNI